MLDELVDDLDAGRLVGVFVVRFDADQAEAVCAGEMSVTEIVDACIAGVEKITRQTIEGDYAKERGN